MTKGEPGLGKDASWGTLLRCTVTLTPGYNAQSAVSLEGAEENVLLYLHTGTSLSFPKYTPLRPLEILELKYSRVVSR